MKIETDQRQTHRASYSNCEQNIVNNWNDSNFAVADNLNTGR